MSKSVDKTRTTVNLYEVNWVLVAPRPEWERPGYWEQFHGLVPEKEWKEPA